MQHYLKTRKISRETCYSKQVVSFEPFPKRITGSTILHYGQYNKKNKALIDALTLQPLGAVAPDGPCNSAGEERGSSGNVRRTRKVDS